VRGRPVFLVPGDFLATTDVYRKVVDRLGEQVTTFTGVKPNPTTSEIGAGVSVYLQSRPDVVVAYGGGSVMDATKVMHKAALDAGCGAPEGIYAIPTTSGSGSEVTSFAVVTDEQTHTKVPIASSELVAGLAILDPEAVVGVPAHITADSGMDVLTHATEAYVALEACDFSDALAEKAVEHLPRFDMPEHRITAFVNGLSTDNIDFDAKESILRVYGRNRFLGMGRYEAAKRELYPLKVFREMSD